MDTIAITSHQKEINVKISLFSLSQQFKSLFSGTFSLHMIFFAWKINSYWDIQIFSLAYNIFANQVSDSLRASESDTWLAKMSI